MNDDFKGEIDTIDYGRLIDDAMHSIVKKALQVVQRQGLPGGHHFFITFLTEHPDVMMSDTLLERYPHEMTIALQYQFWDLEVEDKAFSVVLSFDNVRENLTIPFDALTAFADPSVKFGLQFRHGGNVYKDGAEERVAVKPAKGKKAKQAEAPKNVNNVVSLDSFRKK